MGGLPIARVIFLPVPAHSRASQQLPAPSTRCFVLLIAVVSTAGLVQPAQVCESPPVPLFKDLPTARDTRHLADRLYLAGPHLLHSRFGYMRTTCALYCAFRFAFHFPIVKLSLSQFAQCVSTMQMR